MGFRCSILGCEYERAEPERDREQRGDEVVHTVREYEECRRCGDRRLVSENTGVTTARAVEADGSGTDSFAETAPGTEKTGSKTETGTTRVSAPDTEPERGSDPGVGAVPEGDGEDAVILGEDTTTDPPDESEQAETGDGTAAETDDGTVTVDGPVPDDDGVEFIGDDTGEAETDAENGEVGESDVGEDESADEKQDDPASLVEEAESTTETTVVDPPETEAGSGTGSEIETETEGASTEVTGPDTDLDPDSATLEGDAGDGESANDDAEVLDGGAGDITGTGGWPDEPPGEEPSDDHGAWPDPTDGVHKTESSTEEGFSALTADPDDPPTMDEDVGETEVLDGGTTDRSATGDVGGGHDATVEHGPGARTTRTDVGGELHCRSCGFSAPPDDTPHRSGDICPGCGADYLTER